MKKQAYVYFAFFAVILTLVFCNINLVGFVPAAEKWLYFVEGNFMGFAAKQLQEIFVPVVISYAIYMVTNTKKIAREIKKYTQLAKRQNSKVPAPVVGVILGLAKFVTE